MPTGIPKTIGLALSGGGYRAAAFHLGTVACLHDFDLGSAVCSISTVSGGTIFGAAWTTSQMRKETFAQFAPSFERFLLQVNLVERGLKSLSGPAPHTPSRRHDLIAGMANVYAKELLRSGDGKPYLLGDVFAAAIQLREVVFNATEFRHGLAFRFQRSSSPKAIIGNARIEIARDDAARIRLADVVAASSCFPGGFEPLAFPHDFVWPAEGIPPKTAAQFTKNGKPAPIALMDGGIYDNQGIESLLLANDRDERHDRQRLDAFVISDVSAAPDDLWPFPNEPVRRKGLRLWSVARIWLAMAVICVASFAMLSYLAITRWQAGLFAWHDALVFGVPLLLTGTVGFGLWWGYALVRDEGLTKVPKLGDRSWELLKDISVRQLIGMLSLRIRSLLSLTSSIFMARIRRLGFALVYENERYADSRISNLIYELCSGRNWPEELVATQVPAPSPAMRKVCDVASAMPTILWFETTEQYHTVVAAGRMTMCINLLKWIARRKDPSPELLELQSRLREKWRTWVALDEKALLATTGKP